MYLSALDDGLAVAIDLRYPHGKQGRNGMSGSSFVVELVGAVSGRPHKHFVRYSDASAHAIKAVQSGEADLANIYETPGINARVAVDLVVAGGAKLVGSKARQITPEEEHRAAEVDLRRDFPGTILKLLGLGKK